MPDWVGSSRFALSAGQVIALYLGNTCLGTGSLGGDGGSCGSGMEEDVRDGTILLSLFSLLAPGGLYGELLILSPRPEGVKK